MYLTYRTEQAYDILFNFLTNELGGFEPQSVMTDFEIVSKNLTLREFSK